ncbi:D-inositol 3-phosphate glycosyltransferase [Fundidesulfovibrio magnetotacticus]|uniref:D-inositol 3-phosphate glycosyltransferase n=1 Tax=Fundidesulfovibrio magnetotacticus TaxID=2730080 RepID=A0A6V8M470_9BACT|nr:glycosyltransferase family 1 protein [Fundidesulfovibrio magnetotacticus]GFK95205.1 D-inositol 3-phosphate glycosyltransferase [Fundidesulfovibrio magnetotacticus]
MARKLRLIVNALPLTGVNTGIGRYLRCLYEAFQKKHGGDFEIAWFDGRRALPHMPPPGSGVSGRSRLAKLLWKLPPLAGLAVRLAVHARREAAFRRAARGFDLYHEAAFFPFAAPRGVRTVFTVHDLSLIRHPEHHPRERVLYFELFFRRRLEKVSRFLAVSEFTRREMADVLAIPPGRVDITHNAIDPQRFRPSPGASRVPGLDPGEPYFLFLGTNDPRKNPHVIPKALARSGLKTPLVLAGWSGWSGEEKAAGRVIELGYVPDEALPGLYSDALALVYPSVYEGFGLPVLEAMACGCPVITSGLSSLPEVGGEACLYLDDPSDPEAMAHAMRRLAGDAALRGALRARGLEQARRFSWSASADVAARAFRHALDEPR